MFHDMFAIPIPIMEKILRPVLVYVFLVIVLRVFGKRELAQLNTFDLVVLLSLSNTVQNAMIGDDNSLAGGLIGAFTLLLCNYLLVRFLFRHHEIDKLVEGESTVLVRNGVIDDAALTRELITREEFDTAARRQGFEGLDEVESATLEPGGLFSMKRKEPTEFDRRQRELTDKLDSIANELRDLKNRMS